VRLTSSNRRKHCALKVEIWISFTIALRYKNICCGLGGRQVAYKVDWMREAALIP
jgi:hypothetical protein